MAGWRRSRPGKALVTVSIVRLVRAYRFAASHLYRRPEWSEEENRRRFGACATEPGHGHNYRLEIALEGEPDRETGFVADLPALDALVRRLVVEELDHRHINHAILEFAPGGRIPSCENLVLWIVSVLERELPGGARLEGVRLFESEDLGAEWTHPR